jgi:hypothetical protein
MRDFTLKCYMHPDIVLSICQSMSCRFTLCFVVAKGIPFTARWDAWRSNASYVDFLVHSSVPDAVPRSWQMHMIPTCIPTKLFDPSLTQAMLLLLKYGIMRHQDETHKFFFVSDSTLPCQSPETFRRVLCGTKSSLMTHDRFWEFHKNVTAVRPYIPKHPVKVPPKVVRHYAALQTIPRPKFILTGQWVAITRNHVHLLQREFNIRLHSRHHKYIVTDSIFWATALLDHNISLEYAPLTYQIWRPAPQKHPLWLSEPHHAQRCSQYGYLTSRKWPRDISDSAN